MKKLATKKLATKKLAIPLAGLAAGALIAATFLPVGASAQQATLYKNPNCGCCDHYAAALRRNGFEVTVDDTRDLYAVNDEAGIPGQMQSCHVMFVDGYAVSGHIPVEIVQRLLAERPALKAITLPGMPAGSPGMGGAKTEPFTVYGIGADGVTVYAVE